MELSSDHSAPTAENTAALSWCFSLNVLGLVLLLYLGFREGWRRDGVQSSRSGSWDLGTSTLAPHLVDTPMSLLKP